MNKSSARRALAITCVFLFVLVAAAGAQTYSVLTNFDGTNGESPVSAPIIDSSGNVFGTTPAGGSRESCGLVYELVNNGGGSYTNRTLYEFTSCQDSGAEPSGGVVMDSAGNLYGVAIGGGENYWGVVYELVNNGGGSYTFEVIHGFTGGNGGGEPVGDLVMLKGSLYGVTNNGGGGDCNYYGCGNVFRLTKSGGQWVETVLHTFKGKSGDDGRNPFAGVVIDRDGNIYGTTSAGGSFTNGTVYKLSAQSNGSYKETILHSFDGGTEGCIVYSGVVLDSAGSPYGTAAPCGDDYDGMVYRLKRSGSKYGFGVIFAFDGTNGGFPYEQFGHLAIDSAGNIYGTAGHDGPNIECDCGIVFKLAAGSFLYTDLHVFDGTDGGFPYGGVSLDSLGNLYGTTNAGGSGNGGWGTVWQIANP